MTARRSSSVYRFAVGSAEGERSAIWRRWTVAARNDVYLAARSVAGDYKVSLHASGKWRVAFTRPDSPLLPPGEDRARYKWQRPTELTPGWTRAFQVAIPASEVVLPRLASAVKGVEWFPRPRTGWTWHFDVFLAHAGVDPTKWPGRNFMNTRPVFSAPLACGETVWLLAHEAKLSAEFIKMLAEHKAHIETSAKAASGAIDWASMDTRGFLQGTVDDDGTPFFVDIWIRTPADA